VCIFSFLFVETVNTHIMLRGNRSQIVSPIAKDYTKSSSKPRSTRSHLRIGWIVLFVIAVVVLLYRGEKCDLHNDYNNFSTAKKIEVSSLQPPAAIIVPESCNAPSRGGEFDKIYETGHWVSGKVKFPADFYGDAKWPPKDIRKLSGSGAGSYLGLASETSLRILKDTILSHGVRSVVDIPCGDVNWILDSYVTDTLPLYVGLDIVDAVITSNNKRYSHHENKHFFLWDATHCDLPKFFNVTTSTEQHFDLVHVRDVIQHMPLGQGVKYFCGIFRSGAKLLVTTTYPKIVKNKDLQTEGDWYKNNLELEPFSFPRSTNCIQTHPDLEDDSTCVYDLTLPWVREFVANKCE